MAKNKKRHGGSPRTYQEMKRKEAQNKQALSDEANLPDKKDGRKISIVGALVMLAVGFALYLFNDMPMALVLLASAVGGGITIFLMTWRTVRRNQAKTRKELK